jgi:methionyl-tRNA synthetase
VTTLRLPRDGEWRDHGERTTQRKDALWPRLEPAPSTPLEIPTKEPTVSERPKDAPPSPPTPTTGVPASAAPGTSPADAPTASYAAPVTSRVEAGEARLSIDEFMKIDLRVARVTAAERVPNSKRLVKLAIDLGTEQRIVVAGIAEAYEASSLVGRHVAVVANLKPAKLMGIESNGMVLAASPDGGQPILVAFDQPPPLGTRVR